MATMRYSRPKFRVTLLVACAITAMVSGVVWMLLNAFYVLRANFYAGLSALTFFAFISVTMLLRYLRDDVVLAALPTGLYDARWQTDPIAWERIREIVARRREDEVELDVYLWQPQSSESEHRPDHVIELAPLEGNADSLMETMARHVRFSVEYPAGWMRFDKVAGVKS